MAEGTRNPDKSIVQKLWKWLGFTSKRKETPNINDQNLEAEGGRIPDEPSQKKRREELQPSTADKQYSVTGAVNSTVETAIAVWENHGGINISPDRRKELAESTKRKIKVSTKEMIRVSTVDKVVNKLNSGTNWITITGSAGDGKTTLGYLVLKEFVDQQKVYVIKTPDDYHHIFNVGENRIIVLNDIFGSFVFEKSSINKWTDVITDIFDFQMKNPDNVTQVVFVSRKNILQKAKVYLEHHGENIADENNWFDLSQRADDDVTERRQILDFHLERKGITVSDGEKERVTERDTLHGFPHCCEMFADLVSKKHDIDIVAFFKTPLKFLDKTTKLLFEKDCKDLFVSLVKNDGKLNPNSVENENERWNLREVASHQEGSYLRRNEQGFWVFSHPSIYESVLSVLAVKDPLLFLRYARTSVIWQKVRFKSPKSETITYHILLDPKEPGILEVLAEKLVDIYQRWNFELFKHSVSSNEEFCDSLIPKLTKHINDTKTMIRCHLELYTSLYSNYAAVKSLLKHGADPNKLDVNLRLPLSMCCDPDIVKLLINSGADVNLVDFKWKSPLLYMCERKDVNIDSLHLLIKNGAKVNHVDLEGMTPLHYVCKHDEVEDILQLLIKSGADINHADDEGKTPLHYMCEYGNVSVDALQLLINSETDVNLVDKEGKTPLQYTSDQAYVSPSVDTLQLLINGETDFNRFDELGKAPLHYMFEHGYASVEALQLLIDRGAAVNLVDKEGKTPLHFMCECGDERLDALQLLVNNETDVNIVDVEGKTPLHYMCEHDYVDFDTLHLLITSGADVNLVDEEGKTALHYMCERIRISVDSLQLLINSVEDVNRGDNSGKTALHYMCGNGSVTIDTLQVLINSGAYVDQPDTEGHTPLHYFFKFHKFSSPHLFRSCVQCLVSKGAELDRI